MCGIAGKISLDNRPVTAAAVTTMCQALQHRGPDDSGVYISDNQAVGLGHRRLSVIDLTSAGHQPMSYKNRYWITFNGEIYNFRSLRQQLEQNGYTFSSQTDTEVILALYDKYQEQCVTHLRGMFAFAIYDTQKQRLFCTRDRVGKKPFKYFFNGRVFIFASELKAILTQPEYKREPDERALHYYFTLHYCPAPLTGFKDIQKLEPGHYLILDCQKKKLIKQRYWHLQYQPKLEYSENEWERQILSKLTEAIRIRLVADVPLGAWLSGGIDSSAVVGLMSQATQQPIKTFAAGFDHPQYDERPYARQIAQLFKTDHTELTITPQSIDLLTELAAHYEEPYADSSALPTYLLSKLTRQQVTVVLNGDGGDESFGGYSRYSVQKFASRIQWAIPFMNHLVTPTLRTLGQHTNSPLVHRAHLFARTLKLTSPERYLHYFSYPPQTLQQSWYTPYFLQEIRDCNLIAHLTAQLTPTDAPEDQMLALDVQHYLADDLLVKVDIASMSFGLEARSPFLDHELMELTARMPFHLKVRGFNTKKYILKKALSNLLPPHILHRPKKGFGVPIDEWFAEDWHTFIESKLLHQSPHLHTYIRPAAIQSLISDAQKRHLNAHHYLWSLLMVQLWFDQYFS